jgi:hypothetical protein
MVSYIKTQWFRLLVGFVSLIYALTFAFAPAGPDTIEGLNLDIGNMASFLIWFINSLVWLIMSIVNYHDKCIDKLNKRIEALESRAITDIDEVSKNNYMVKRRLGPDKEEV